jgi:hypothetical protein
LKAYLERLLLVMNIPDMPLQVGRDGERALAVLAAVRLLPGVRPKMPRQVGGPRERLAAELARVAAGGEVGTVGRVGEVTEAGGDDAGG